MMRSPPTVVQTEGRHISAGKSGGNAIANLPSYSAKNHFPTHSTSQPSK